MVKENNEKRLEYLKNIVLNMPEKPGSYQYYDDLRENGGKIIYVGKAKNLKRRVSSYFHREVDRFKTKVLVSKIKDISYTVVNTEEDALLLENALIKKYNPKYNVLLKDGKTYPSIIVTNEFFPRIFKTRHINKKLGTYFGPYPHISSMYNVLALIQKAFKPRRCRQPITQEGVNMGKYRPCLEYHIHNCEGCCVSKQSREDYLENIRQAKEVLKGNTRELSEWVYKRMMANAELMKFEEAERLKERYLLLQDFVSKSEVVSHTINDVDVFTITDDDNKKNAYINYIHVKNGTINQSFTYEYKRKLDESDEDLLTQAIPEIRERFGSKSKEIIVPFQMEMFTLSKLANTLKLNTPWGLWIIYLGFGAGLAVFMFTGFVKSIPLEIEEAAMIDGCNPLQTFFGVVLPIMKPTCVTVAILQTMWIWNDYLLPYLVLDLKKYTTIPIAVQYLKGGYGSVDMGAMMGVLVLAIIPIIVFYLFCQKYIIEGVVAGAVKG